MDYAFVLDLENDDFDTNAKENNIQTAQNQILATKTTTSFSSSLVFGRVIWKCVYCVKRESPLSRNINAIFIIRGVG